LKLELDLTQPDSCDQFQEYIDTAAQGKCTRILILMQDGQNKRVQQTDDLLRLYPERDTRVAAASDQFVDERSIICHMHLKRFWGHPQNEQIKVIAREKLQEGNRFHTVKGMLQKREQAGSRRGSREVDHGEEFLAKTLFDLFDDIHEEGFFGRIEQVKGSL
jgi:hypothetical protein